MVEDRDAELMHLEHHKTPLQGARRASDASHGEQEVLQWCTVHEAASAGTDREKNRCEQHKSLWERTRATETHQQAGTDNASR